MMWQHETTLDSSASPEAIWNLWADVANWGRWNGDIEAIELRGEFVSGAEISMTPTGQETVILRLTEVRQNELFVDEARFDGVVLRTIHRLEPLDHHRVRIIYRMEISGPAADELGPRIGPQITADFPQTIAALAELAEA
jgi:hypothetical protein